MHLARSANTASISPNSLKICFWWTPAIKGEAFIW